MGSKGSGDGYAEGPTRTSTVLDSCIALSEFRIIFFSSSGIPEVFLWILFREREESLPVSGLRSEISRLGCPPSLEISLGGVEVEQR